MRKKSRLPLPQQRKVVRHPRKEHQLKNQVQEEIFRVQPVVIKLRSVTLLKNS